MIEQYRLLIWKGGENMLERFDFTQEPQVDDVDSLIGQIAQTGAEVAAMQERNRKIRRNKWPFMPTTRTTFGAYDGPGGGGDDGGPGGMLIESTAKELFHDHQKFAQGTRDVFDLTHRNKGR